MLVPANDIEVTVKGSKNIDDITVSGDNSKVILDNASADNVTLDGEKSAVETKNGAKIDNVIMSVDISTLVLLAFISGLLSTVFAVGYRLQRDTEGLV